MKFPKPAPLSVAAVALLATSVATTLVTPTSSAFAQSPESSAPVASYELTFTGEPEASFGTLSRDTCDVNGDGFDDIVVGSQNWNRPDHAKVGAGYVLFGGDRVAGGDVSDPAAAGAVRIDGPAVTVTAGAWIGFSVSCLGDVNGDGIDDFVLGTGSRLYHKPAVVFGSRDFGPLDVENLGSRGYTIEDSKALDTSTGDRATDNFGYWVGPVGDINGDGLADVGIIDLLADHNGFNNSGRVWVVSGQREGGTVDVWANSEKVLATVDGVSSGDRVSLVDAAGDIDGDGKDDLLLGGYVAKPWAAQGSSTTANGAGYLIRGSAQKIEIDMAAAGGVGDSGTLIAGPKRGQDRLGMSGSAIGDINGDGKGDVLLGADGSTTAKFGGAAVVLGASGTAPVMVDPDSDPSVFSCADGAQDTACAASAKVARGYWINGAAAGSKAGFGTASMEDANGDGIRDLVIGAYGERATYVVYAEPERTAALELSALTPAQGERYVGVAGSGRSVGSAGDFDGNGVADLAVGGASNAVNVILRGALKSAVTVSAPTTASVGARAEVSVEIATLVGGAGKELAGTVALTRGGAVVEGLGAVPVVAGKASFALPVQTVGAATYSVAYVPAAGGEVAAGTAAFTLTGEKATSSGVLTLSSTEASAGEPVIATVTSSNTTLTGPVEFLVDGRSVGEAELTAGTASFTVADLTVGQHTIEARWAGSEAVAGFATTAASLTVVKAASNTAAVSPSVNRLVAGLALTVSTSVEGAAGGTVRFLNGRTLLATATVGEDGIASAKVAGLKPGNYALIAEYVGTDQVAASVSSESVKVAVVKATGTMAVKPSTFKAGSKPKVTVTFTRLSNGALPRGVVTVVANGVTKKVRVNGKAYATVTLPKTARSLKTLTVKASFAPNDAVNVASYKAKTVKLVAAKR